MKKIVYLLIVVCLLGACSERSGVKKGSGLMLGEKKVFGGNSIAYVYLPESYTTNKQYPVVFTLHYPESYRGFVKPFADSNDIIIAVLDNWDFMIIDSMKKKFSIDTDRLYLTGWSAGGAGTYSVACERPDLFAAINPMFCGYSMYAGTMGNESYIYFHYNYLPNLIALPVRFTPESIAFNSHIVFYYLQKRMTTLGAKNFFVDIQNAVPHSQEGMQQDFPKAIKYFLGYKRNRYPERFAITSALYSQLNKGYYYIRDIVQRDTNYMIRLDCEVRQERLYIETRNISGLTVTADDLKQLDVDPDQVVVNGVAKPSGRIEIATDIDREIKRKYDYQDVKAKRFDVHYTVDNCFRAQAKTLMELECTADTTNVLIESAQDMPVVSVKSGDKELPFVRLIGIPQEKTIYCIYLPVKAKLGETIRLSVTMDGTLPFSRPETPAGMLRNTDVYQGYFEASLGILLPKAAYNNNEGEYRLKVDFRNENPKAIYRSSFFTNIDVLSDLGVRREGNSFTIQGTNFQRDSQTPVVLTAGFGKFSVEAERVSMKYYVNDDWNNAVMTNLYRTFIDYYSSRYPMRKSFCIIDAASPLYITLQMRRWDSKMFLFNRIDAAPEQSETIFNAIYPCRRGSLIRFSPYEAYEGRSDTDLEYRSTNLSQWNYRDAVTIAREMATILMPPIVDPNLHQMAFMQALSKYLTYRAMRDLGLISPVQYGMAYAARVQRMMTVLQPIRYLEITNYESATLFGKKIEWAMMYLDSLFGKEQMQSLIAMMLNTPELFREKSPLTAFMTLIDSEPVKLGLARLFDSGAPLMPDISASLSGSGDNKRLEIVSDKDIDLPVRIAFNSYEKTLTNIWFQVRAGKNTFKYPKKTEADLIVVNPEGLMLESDPENNTVAVDLESETVMTNIKEWLIALIGSKDAGDKVTRVGNTFILEEIRERVKTGELKLIYICQDDNDWIAVFKVGNEYFSAVLRQEKEGLKVKNVFYL